MLMLQIDHCKRAFSFSRGEECHYRQAIGNQKYIKRLSYFYDKACVVFKDGEKSELKKEMQF